MKLEQMHYFSEIGRKRSISAAARALHIRQTTLSAAVKSLEEELGFPVFQRSPAGVVPTPMGEEFLSLAGEIDRKYEALLSLKRRSGQNIPTIQILLAPALSTCLPVPLTRLFHLFFVQSNLHFRECMSLQAGELVRKKEANIALAYLPEGRLPRLEQELGRDGVRLRRIFRDELYLMLPTGCAWAAERVDFRSLTGLRLATTKPVQDDVILGNVSDMFPYVTMFSDIDLLRQAVENQGMFSLLPRFPLLAAGWGRDPTRMEVRRVYNTEYPNQVTLCLIHREERQMKDRERLMLSCILDYFRRFQEEYPEFRAAEGEEDAL